MSDYDPNLEAEAGLPGDEPDEEEESENEASESEASQSQAPEGEATKKVDKGPKVKCVDCGKKWFSISESNRFYRTPEGARCAAKAPCRARQLGDEFERRKLNKWGRRTQEQLLAIMDCPPKDWDRKTPWISVTPETGDRVLAALEYFSICYPVCLFFAVQTAPDGEPIWDPYLGTWKHHTVRTLGDILGIHQTTVNRVILDLKARGLIEEYDGRFYSVLAPKSLNPVERQACTRAISDYGTSFTALLPRARTFLFETLGRLPPEACTQLRQTVVEACIVQNRKFSEARAQTSEAVFEACNAHISLLSRVLDGESDSPSTSSSSSESGRVPADNPRKTDDDEKERRNDALYAAGAGEGALAKLPSPRNFPGKGAPSAEAAKPAEVPPVAEIPLVSQPRSSRLPRVPEPPPPPPPELPTTNAIADACAVYSRPDEKGIIQILTECRRHVPNVTEQEVAAMVHSKGEQASRKTNPFGFLLEAVPNAFEGETYRRRRAREQDAVTAEASRQAEFEEAEKQRIIHTARRTLADPTGVPEDDLKWARQTLKEYGVAEVAEGDGEKSANV
jgi:hypothetical protein